MLTLYRSQIELHLAKILEESDQARDEPTLTMRTNNFVHTTRDLLQALVRAEPSRYDELEQLAGSIEAPRGCTWQKLRLYGYFATSEKFPSTLSV